VHKNGRTFEPREVEPTVSAPAGAEGAGGTFNRKAGTRKEGFHSSSTDAVWTIQAGVAGKLRYEVRRLFENSGLDEFQPHRKTGSLDSKSLTKVATGSSRLFKRRMEVEGIDSAVVIALDISGSMFRDYGNPDAERMTAAIQTTAALLDTLGAWGLEVVLVESGVQALISLAQARSQKPFEVALLDQHMPGLSGLDLARALHVDRSFDGLKILWMGGLGHGQSSGNLQEAVDIVRDVYCSGSYRSILRSRSRTCSGCAGTYNCD
jgi:hypothetical protein